MIIKKFDKEEIEIISSNIDISKIDNKLFPKAVLEIKLNRNKVENLFCRLERAHQIIKYKIKENAIFLGFINSKSVDTKIMANIKKKLKDMNYILFGVKDNKFAKREITQFYDWIQIYRLEKRFKAIEDDIKNIKIKLDELISLRKTLFSGK